MLTVTSCTTSFQDKCSLKSLELYAKKLNSLYYSLQWNVGGFFFLNKYQSLKVNSDVRTAEHLFLSNQRINVRQWVFQDLCSILRILELRCSNTVQRHRCHYKYLVNILYLTLFKRSNSFWRALSSYLKTFFLISSPEKIRLRRDFRAKQYITNK